MLIPSSSTSLYAYMIINLSYLLIGGKYLNNIGNVYFTMHETLGTASSPDTTDGVPRVICRFGKVVYNKDLYHYFNIIS